METKKERLELKFGIKFEKKENNGCPFYVGKYHGATVNIFHTGKYTIQGSKEAEHAKQELILFLEEQKDCSLCRDTKDPKIFIVYGHDREVQDRLEHIFLRFGVSAEKVINDSSMTIIEALEEKISTISAGIVLLTPDDFAASRKDYEVRGAECLHMQARQNVILEMGMLMAKLGRDKVIILEKGDVKEPSDINGIFSLRFTQDIKEIVPKLAKRLIALGFSVNLERALEILE